MNSILAVPTQIRDEHVCVTPVLFENTESVECFPCTDVPGLVCKYSFTDRSMNDRDMWLSGHAYGPGRSEGIVDQDGRSKIGGPGLLLDPPSSSMNGGLVVLSLGDLRSLCGNPKALCDGQAMLAEYTDVEFSKDDQDVLYKHLVELMSRKDRIVIVEIGVCRNEYHQTSTSIFIDNKRPGDIYIGIDISDKSFLNDPSRGVFTIQSPSQDFDRIFDFFNSVGISEIDLFMVDGWHSVNQVYAEWTYTQLLSSVGVVVFHDTNAHPGPYFMMKSIDSRMYDVRKYMTDVQDWGIGVAVRI